MASVLFQTVRPKSEGTLVLMGLVFIQRLELNKQLKHNGFYFGKMLPLAVAHNSSCPLKALLSGDNSFKLYSIIYPLVVQALILHLALFVL